MDDAHGILATRSGSDDTVKLSPFLPPGFLERVAEDASAGAIVALGLQGIAAAERIQAADRRERQQEREAELELKRLALEERKEAAARTERERAAQRLHEVQIWQKKQRFLVLFGAFCCFSIVIVGVYLIVNSTEAVLGASIAGAAAAVLSGLAKDLIRGISGGPRCTGRGRPRRRPGHPGRRVGRRRTAVRRRRRRLVDDRRELNLDAPRVLGPQVVEDALGGRGVDGGQRLLEDSGATGGQT